MIFESHVHFDDEAFKEDREAAIKRAREAGVEKLVNIGASMETSRRSLELSKQYDFMYTTIGVHPYDVPEMKEKHLEILLAMATYEKVVAIGEIGLDYHYDNISKTVQKLWFREQLNIARDLNLPVVIHSRDAAQDTYEILQDYELDGVIHCYSYSPEMAKKFVDLGYYIGVGGVVTFKNAKNLVQTVKEIPLEKILVETDAPYLAPEPKRGKRNESAYLPYIIEKIAEIKGIDKEIVEDITYRNGIKLYKL